MELDTHKINDSAVNDKKLDDTEMLSLGLASVAYLYMTICIWIIGSSFTVLVYFVRQRKEFMKNVFHSQILSLSVNDFIAGLSMIPIYVTGFEVKHDLYVCVFRYGIFMSAQIVVLFHILGICVGRVLIVFRRNRQLYTTKKTVIMSIYFAMAWVFSLLTTFSTAIYLGNGKPNRTKCQMPSMFLDSYGTITAYILTVCAVPFMLTNIIYFIIISKLCCHNYKITPDLLSGLEEQQISTGSCQCLNENTSGEHDTNRVNTTVKFNQRFSAHAASSNNNQCSLHALQMNTAVRRSKTDECSVNENVCPSVSADLSRKEHDEVHRYINTKHFTGFRKPPCHCKRDNEITRFARHHVRRDGRVPVTKNQRKATVTIGIVLIAFDACVLPFLGGFVVEKLTGVLLSTKARTILTTILPLNSAINPVIYISRIPRLRAALKDMYVCK